MEQGKEEFEGVTFRAGRTYVNVDVEGGKELGSVLRE